MTGVNIKVQDPGKSTQEPEKNSQDPGASSNKIMYCIGTKF